MSARRFRDGELLLATHNRGKLLELKPFFEGRGIGLVSSIDLALPEPQETGLTFAENALLKARAACEAAGRPALGDDSGIAVSGLDGAPGIYSARWAGPQKDFAMAMRRVQEELTTRFGSWEAADKRAAFICVVTLAWPDGYQQSFTGQVDGRLVWPPRGDRGFGYDPIFEPEGERRTFGEMSFEEKQQLSHRRRAIDALLVACF